MVVLAAACGAAVLCAGQLAEFSRSPTRTLLWSRHLPLGSLPFPAVTLCPTVKTNRTLAKHLITRWLEDRGLAAEADASRVESLLAALSLLQFPFYKRLAPHLRAAAPLPQHLRGLNVTDFMLKVLPSCRSVFHACFWLRQEMDCCEMFQLRPTEIGYCYSFNTLSLESSAYCDLAAWRRQDRRCQLASTAGEGARSALIVVLQPQDPRHALPYGMQRDAGAGLRVVVHSPLSYPDPGARGLLVNAAAGSPVVRVTVAAQLTFADDEVRGVARQRRGCLMPDEWPARKHGAAPVYDERLCLARCRGRHIRTRCGCLPYFYGEDPVCNLTQMLCVATLDDELRFPASAPSGRRLQCAWCAPACSSLEYRSSASPEPATGLVAHPLPAIDVHYGRRSGTLYVMQRTFTARYLLVSVGSILGLALGCSALSLVELAYYLARLLLAVSRRRHRRTAHRVATESRNAGPGGGRLLAQGAAPLLSVHLQRAARAQGTVGPASQPYLP